VPSLVGLALCTNQGRAFEPALAVWRAHPPWELVSRYLALAANTLDLGLRLAGMPGLIGRVIGLSSGR
jgi:hypothetical protein